jgi:hypothetical protein
MTTYEETSLAELRKVTNRLDQVINLLVTFERERWETAHAPTPAPQGGIPVPNCPPPNDIEVHPSKPLVVDGPVNDYWTPVSEQLRRLRESLSSHSPVSFDEVVRGLILLTDLVARLEERPVTLVTAPAPIYPPTPYVPPTPYISPSVVPPSPFSLPTTTCQADKLQLAGQTHNHEGSSSDATGFSQ